MKVSVVFSACLLLFSGSNAQLNNRRFPEGFLFGLGTSAYQVEGAWNEDGKGESMWDRYLHDHQDLVADNSNGDVADDSYHKTREDVQLLKQIGVDYYRFSLSWPRILPDGTTDNVNQAGVDYYQNLIRELKDNGIEPMVTLYHWDLPQTFNEIGGWTNPAIADYFADYARVCFELFGDQVKYWATVNEAATTCVSGYGTGDMAPGTASASIGVGIYQCGYTQVLAHAKAWHVYDDEFRARQNGKISIVVDSSWNEARPADASGWDAQERSLNFRLGWFANPIFSTEGDWPAVMRDRIGNRSIVEGLPKSRLPAFTPEQVDYIRGTYDYFGINTYTSYYSEHQDDWYGEPSYWGDIGVNSYQDPSWEPSASGWLVKAPFGMRSLLNWIDQHYNHPEIIVTENGWSDRGGTEDWSRVDYYQQYLSSMLDAIYDDNVNVIAYTAWSYVDNFEWMQGYTERFGMVDVDFNNPDRPRTLKQSAYYYQSVLRNRCLVDNCVD